MSRSLATACLAVALIAILGGEMNPGEFTVKLACALLLLALIWTLWETGA